MAPGWRHGWVITLKRGGTRFLMKPNILWKFEDDSDTISWDKWTTKLGGRNKEIRFVQIQ